MKKEIRYTPVPEVCSTEIQVVVEDDIISEVVITGGCHGNTQGISALLKGMHKDQAIRRLEGIRCKKKMTSCPDQLAKALRSL